MAFSIVDVGHICRFVKEWNNNFHESYLVYQYGIFIFTHFKVHVN